MAESKKAQREFWFSAISFWVLSLCLLFLVYKIIPVFAAIYEGFDAKLPTVIRIVFNFSSLMRQWFLFSFPGSLCVIVGITFLMKALAGKVPLFIFPLATFVLIAILIIACFWPFGGFSSSIKQQAALSRSASGPSLAALGQTKQRRVIVTPSQHIPFDIEC